MITIRSGNGEVLAHFDNNVPDGVPYFEPVMEDNMETLVSRFSFSVPLGETGTEHLQGLNQVLAKDREGDLRLFIISDVYEEWTTVGGEVRVECEDISITEMNSIIVSPIKVSSFKEALDKAFGGSGWTYRFGANWKEVDDTSFIMDEYTNLRDTLAKIRNTYDCQFKFMAQEDAFGKVTRVVEVFKTVGNDTGKYFYYDRDLIGIKRDISYDEVKTAIYAFYRGTGANSDKFYTLNNWVPTSQKEGFTKNYASPLIINDEAHSEWDEPEVYKTLAFQSSITTGDREQVYREACDKILEYNAPIYTYQVDVVLLQNLEGWEGETVELGDTVWLKEKVGDRELGLEARVIAYEYHEDDPSADKVTFSNFKEIDTTDTDILSNMIFFAYSNSEDGTVDFSIGDSTGKSYIGVYTSSNPTQSTNPFDYKWAKFAGQDGQDGVGVASTTVEYASGTSGTITPADGWVATVPPVAPDNFLWTRTVWNYTDNTSEKSYSVSKMGANGAQGADGKTYYTYTAYSWSSDGTDRFTTTYPNDNLFIYKGADKGFIDSNGNPVTQNNVNLEIVSKDFFPVKAGEKLSIQYGLDLLTGQNGWMCIGFYDDNGVFVGSRPAWATSVATSDGYLEIPQGIVWTVVQGATQAKIAMRTYGGTPKIKVERGDKRTIYTPSPVDNILEAYPSYTGMYSSTDPIQSQNPSDYVWARTLGESSITHTAYAWSADGSDRFTTEYPPDNILEDSSFRNLSSKWTNSFQGIVSNGDYTTLTKDVIATNRCFYYQGFGNKKLSQGTYYTILIHYYVESTEGTGTNSHCFLRTIFEDGTSNDMPLISLNLDKVGEWQTAVVTGRIQDKPIESHQFTFAVAETRKAVVRVKEFKLAEGTHPNMIWTPLPSESFAEAYPTYIGTYTDSDPVQSLDYKKYEWARILGEDGADGKDGENGKDGSDGVGVTGTVVTYQVGTSGTSAPTGNWTASVPQTPENQYLWSRTVISYSNGTSSTSYSVARNGVNGTNGIPYFQPTEPVGTDIKNGDTWFKTKSSTDMTVVGVYTRVSNVWETAKFDQEALSVEKLSALSADLGNVTAGNIVGVDISGSKFTSSFSNTTTLATTEGTTVIEKGMYTNDWTIKNLQGVVQTTGQNQITTTGYSSLYRVGGVANQVIKSEISPDGVVMSDYRYTPSYGLVNLKYQDLMEMPPTEYAMWNSDWSPYDQGNSRPLVSRKGRLIQVTGAVKNNVTIDGGSSWIRVGTLPIWARPPADVRVMCQGSTTSMFVAALQPGGAILVSRYRNSADYNTAVGSGSWWNIACTFVAKDL